MGGRLLATTRCLLPARGLLLASGLLLATRSRLLATGRLLSCPLFRHDWELLEQGHGGSVAPFSSVSVHMRRNEVFRSRAQAFRTVQDAVTTFRDRFTTHADAEHACSQHVRSLELNATKPRNHAVSRAAHVRTFSRRESVLRCSARRPDAQHAVCEMRKINSNERDFLVHPAALEGLRASFDCSTHRSARRQAREKMS